jgi:hypothetical protein
MRQWNPESSLTRSRDSIVARARRIPIIYPHLMHDREKTDRPRVPASSLVIEPAFPIAGSINSSSI